jgi:NTE family protein
MEKKKVALVLGAGGARGLAHIGVIEELEARGYEISSIAGTSIGSVIGGVYAARQMEEYKNWLLSFTLSDVFKMMDLTLSGGGFIKGKKVFEEMQKLIPERNIEDLDIPFVALATDLASKSEIAYRSGSLYNAIRASVSIPSTFTPFYDEDKVLVDGGLINPIPISFVERTPGDIVVVVNLNAKHSSYIPTKVSLEIQKEKELKIYNGFKEKMLSKLANNQHDKFGYYHIITETISVLIQTISDYQLKTNPHDVLIEISRDSCSTFDFHKSKSQILLGRKSAQIAMERFEKQRGI